MSEIIDFASSIAREAGQILLEGFRSQETEISFKSRTNLVTSMDYASEKHLVSAIEKKYHNHTIIAEEGSGKESHGDYIWYIDPLDATNNYAHGIPIFCVSIGVYHANSNTPFCGVVYDPLHDELFSAQKNCGAFLNDEKIKVSPIDDLGYSILATGFPYDKENSEINNVDNFQNFLPKLQGIRRLGSAAIDLCYVACGRIDGYWEGELCQWDTAAGSLIVEEAGGTVTHYNGDLYTLDKKDIVASNGKIHKAMIEILDKN